MKVLRIETPQGKLVLEFRLPDDLKEWHYYFHDDFLKMAIGHVSITGTEEEENEATHSRPKTD